MHLVATEAKNGQTVPATSGRASPIYCREVTYLIVHDTPVRKELSFQLTLAGINVQGFDCAGDYFKCVKQDSAACIIIDVRLPVIEELDFQSQLLGEGVPPAIYISSHPDIHSGIRAIKAGAFDFLFYPVEPDALLSAVKDAFTRDRSIRQRRAESSGLNERYLRLTPREREVFSLVVRGFLNKQVAGILSISQITVQIHRSNLMRKMVAQSFADLVCMAIRLQILGKDLADHC